MSLAARFAQAETLDEFVANAKEHAPLWRATINRIRSTAIPEEFVARAQAIASPRKLLVLLEDWCGDAFNTVPVADELTRVAPHVELRVLSRDHNDDLMQAHLSPGKKRAIPVIIVFDEAFNELGWWGSRPTPLQRWIDQPEIQALEKADRYVQTRRWYIQDRGVTTLSELLTILERDASLRVA